MDKTTIFCSIIIWKNKFLLSKSFLLLFLLALGQIVVAQNSKLLVSVKDSISWQPINETTIHITESNKSEGIDTLILTDKKGAFRIPLIKNKEYRLNIRKKGYLNDSISISTINNDSLQLTIYLKPIITFEYLCPFVHFNFNQFENRSDSAYHELKSFQLDTSFGVRCCVIGFTDEGEEFEIAYKRAKFIQDELVKLGIDRNFIRIQTRKNPLLIDTHFEFISNSFFKISDILTLDYIQKLSPELQKLAHLYNRRAQITVCK